MTEVWIITNNSDLNHNDFVAVKSTLEEAKEKVMKLPIVVSPIVVELWDKGLRIYGSETRFEYEIHPFQI